MATSDPVNETGTAVKRVHYFDGQYLYPEDFTTEQSYQLLQRRTHARALHTPGIAEGLTVTTEAALQVTIAPGVALDGVGRQMVLSEAKTLTLPAGAKGKVAHLYMAYFEEKSDLQSGAGIQDKTRYLEQPAFEVVLSGQAATLTDTLLLARLTLDPQGNITLDESVRQYAGAALPGPKNSAMALTRRGDNGQLLLATDGNDLLMLQSTKGGAENQVNLDFRTFSDSNPLMPTTRLSAIDAGNFSSHLAFLTKEAGQDKRTLVERMRLTADGKLGIGHATPTNRLDVVGSMAIGGNFGGQRAAPENGLLLGGNLRLLANTEILFTDGGRIRSFDDNHAIVFNRAQNQMLLKEFGDILIQTGGNVGVGVDVPAEKLDVIGSVRVRGARLKSKDGFGILQTDGNAEWLRINPDKSYQGSAHYGPLAVNEGGLAVGVWEKLDSGVLKTTQATYLATVGGNVGIGLTGATEKLDVSGNVRVRGARIKNKDGLSIVQTDGGPDWLRINPDKSYQGSAHYGPLAVNEGGLAVGTWEKLDSGVLKTTQATYLATVGGNVGIGLTDPAESLDVSGSVRIRGNRLFGKGGLAIVQTNGGADLLRLNPDKHYEATVHYGPFALVDGGLAICAGDVVMSKASPGILNVMDSAYLASKGGRAVVGSSGAELTSDTDVRLQVRGGSLMPQGGNSKASGLYFPPNPGGGSSDEAWLRYYVRDGEACTLEIGIGNDGTDHIALMTKGFVGIGTNEPVAPLHISSTIKNGEATIRLDNKNERWGQLSRWSDRVELMASDEIRLALGSYNSNYLTVTTSKVTAKVDIYAPAHRTASDARLKQNVQPLAHPVETVRGLRGVRYEWRNDVSPHLSLPEGQQVGLIAQEVEGVLPELVTEAEGYKALDYNGLVGLLVEAVKEQAGQIERLTARLAAVEGQDAG